MSNFDFQTTLQTYRENRQLVCVYLAGAPTYKVAYILGVNPDFLTFAEVSSSAQYAGVYLCRLADVEAISTETIYLSELIKQISPDVYQAATQAVASLTDFSFDGFATAFENTNTVVEITLDKDETIAGRLVAHDEDVLGLDEYSTESDRRVARTYFNRKTIARLALDIPWIRTIARSLADKKL